MTNNKSTSPTQDLVLTSQPANETDANNKSDDTGNFFERTINQITSSINNTNLNSSTITNIVTTGLEQVKNFLQKTSELITEERSFSVSQESVNGLLNRFVVAKVSMIQAMRAEIHTDDFTLYASVEAKGVKADISALCNVERFIFDSDTQLMVYKQLQPTQIDSVFYNSMWTHIKVAAGLWFLRNIKKRDVLGFLLEKTRVASVQVGHNDGHTLNDIISIDLAKYMGSDKTVQKTLQKLHVTDANIKEGKLQLISKVNLDGFIKDYDTSSTELTDVKPTDLKSDDVKSDNRVVNSNTQKPTNQTNSQSDTSMNNNIAETIKDTTKTSEDT